MKSRPGRAFWSGFGDGFGMAGLFLRSRLPGARTRLFAPSSTLAISEESLEKVLELMSIDSEAAKREVQLTLDRLGEVRRSESGVGNSSSAYTHPHAVA